METSTVSITNQFPSTALPMFQSWCDAKQIQVLTFMKTSNAINATMNLTLLTIIGNILTLLSLRRSSRLHAASKVLYCSLAVSDLGVGLVVQPAFFIRLVVGPSIPETCDILGVITIVAGVISVVIYLQILSAISVDCVLVIRKEVASIFRVRLVLITCWFFRQYFPCILDLLQFRHSSACFRSLASLCVSVSPPSRTWSSSTLCENYKVKFRITALKKKHRKIPLP